MSDALTSAEYRFQVAEGDTAARMAARLLLGGLTEQATHYAKKFEEHDNALIADRAARKEEARG